MQRHTLPEPRVILRLSTFENVICSRHTRGGNF